MAQSESPGGRKVQLEDAAAGVGVVVLKQGSFLMLLMPDSFLMPS